MTKTKASLDTRIDDLVLLTERLTGLIGREIDLLMRRRPSEIESFTTEKEKLASLYGREMAALKRDRALLAELSDERKTKLKDATTAFRKALDELASLVGRIRKVSEGMIQAIAEEVNAKRAHPIGYGKNAAPVAKKSQATSFALNQKV